MVISPCRSVLYHRWPSSCVMLGYACLHGPSHLAQENVLHIWMKERLCLSMCKFWLAINKASIQESTCQWGQNINSRIRKIWVQLH